MKQWYDFHIVLKSLLSPATIDRWVSGITIEKYDARNIYLLAKDSFQIDWFKEHIMPIASKRLLNHQNKPYKLHIRIKSEKILKPKKTSKIITSDKYKKFKVPQNVSFDSFIPTKNTLLTLQVFTHLSKSLKEKSQNISLDANPILLYGEKSSGKTHLLHALYHSFKENGFNPLYVTTPIFTEHFVKALREHDMKNFRNFYRSFDALLIDDVEVLAQKTATQEEFFHTFNLYHSLEKPIILSSQIAPKDIKSIEPRLISRFEWGLALSLEALSQKEFKELISIKCKDLSLQLDQRLKNYLQTNIEHVGDLVKTLQMLSFKQHLKYQENSHLTLHDLQQIIQQVLQRSKQAFANEKLLNVIAKYFDCSKESLISSSKTKKLVYPRRMCMYLMRIYGKKPFAQIGSFFSKDHSTIITSVDHISQKLKSNDDQVKDDLKELLHQIKKKPSQNIS